MTGTDRRILQVALDVYNLHRALELGAEAVAGGADWVEAGTPLIKSEGLNAVRELKKAFPDKAIVADMKIMDTGGMETEMAIKAGASIVTVLGASFIGLHVGIDEQMQGRSPVQMVRDVRAATSLPIAVAGGLTSETLAPL